ncbi:MAG: phosphatase PAP2 family protein [Candidatus Marinimicrobia bacterium]|nr:phosphatase PAP2 family protein [Candidatus Neomarinimicrobiota bacterium]
MVSQTTVAAQSLPVPATRQDDPNMVQLIGQGLYSSITDPDLRVLWGLTAAGTLLALPIDREVMPYRHRLMPEPVARFGDLWGGQAAAITILPIIYLVDRSKGTATDETTRRLKFAFTSLVTVGTTTGLLKVAVGRERPNQASRTSFPSGHTSAAFGVAEVIRTLYGPRAGRPFYLAAVITGISRIHDNKHYPSDVIAGAGLGIGVVRGFKLAQQWAGHDHSLQLGVTGQAIGLLYYF